MSDQFLYQKLDSASEMGFLDTTVSKSFSSNLNADFAIRDYQKEAFARFVYYYTQYPKKEYPIHLLYNMATGSGKTLVMAGLILYLYQQGYRNFLFFVNSNNIIEKTKDNFLNSNSSKYLFNDKLTVDNNIISIKEVSNFSESNSDNIQIKFTTIQGLHSDLNNPKENSLTYADFEDKKIVILSDEAHHINATTKSGKLTKDEELEKKSWEITVMKILNSHKDNVLLEFTATIDLTDSNLHNKYKDKIIYRYDLKEFRLDKYSKEVDIIKSDMSQNERILQALLISQYRLKIAEKHKINCKPVILFKAQKTIAESQANKDNFIAFIKDLEDKDIIALQSKIDTPLLAKVFAFFAENKISIDNLVKELKEDFSDNKCISANDDKEANNNQILLNSLEDKTNRIRAVFAVQKLNEGRDVLNLFDIVRLYESRSNVVDKKTGKIKVGPQTIAEAQLIGRGARYYPFNTTEALGEDKYKRKFDNTDHELKILETFYYHTSYDNMYITEIRQALREIGMLDEKEKKIFKLKLKDSFINTELYKTGAIYVNDMVEIGGIGIDSIKKAGIKQQRFEFNVFSYSSDSIHIFDEKNTNNEKNSQSEAITLMIKDIDKNVVKKAIQRNDFYKFNNIHQYFGELESIETFITDSNFLADIKIDFLGPEKVINNLNKTDLLHGVEFVLKQLELEIKDKEIQYKGSYEFKPVAIQKIFKKEKDIMIDLGEKGERFDKEWFVFEEITGTSEEKAFIKLFEKKITELKKKYEDIYLIRSERAFPLFSFEKGERFEPDFVLFMKEKGSKSPITYQVFIEPKGDQLLLLDKRKEEFLLEIAPKAKILDMNLGNYKLIGLPFYNQGLEIEFEKEFDKEFS